MPSSYGKPRQSSKYASDFKREYDQRVVIPEDAVQIGQGIIDDNLSRQKSLISHRDDKYDREVVMPSISRTSSQLAPLMKIGVKNSQEIQYLDRITNKELMSPDLKLDDINKNINFRSRISKKSFVSKSSRKPERPTEPCERFDAHFGKQRNSKSFENLNREPKLPITDHLSMMRPNADILPRLGTPESPRSGAHKLGTSHNGSVGPKSIQERIKSGNKEKRSARQKIGQDIISGSKRDRS